MLAEEELRDRLQGSAGLGALVDGRIFGGRAAQNAALPHVVWKRISGNEEHSLDGPSGLVRGRFAIDCYALTYEASVLVAAEVTRAAQANSPTLELYLEARQDFYEEETPKRFRRSLDFLSLETEALPPPDPGAYTPSLDFSDARNSQYVALLFEDF